MSAESLNPSRGVVQLSARVDQLTAHLKIHRKDYASTRGLMKVLSRRKSLMEYLKAHNRCVVVPYIICVATLEDMGCVTQFAEEIALRTLLIRCSHILCVTQAKVRGGRCNVADPWTEGGHRMSDSSGCQQRRWF